MFGGFGAVTSFWDVLALFFNLLWVCVLIRALLSWLRPDPSNPLVQALDFVTEPILQPLRQIVPRIGMIDITPMIAIVLLSFIAQLLGGLD